MSILVILGSSRKGGNTENLINNLLANIKHERIYLADHYIEPIVDQRHTATGFEPADDDYPLILEKFLAHDTIIFATPLYWFGMSAHMKLFFDRWSQYLRDERYDLKANLSNKQAYVIVTAHYPDPNLTALPLIQQFNHIFSYVGIKFIDYLIGHGNKPNDILTDQLALAKVEQWQTALQLDASL
ncbi:Multimeric flavodoxin WrbA [Amphibacillus marinus]|uniref:Multimeric flavodoxin WrbA n=1 Tax=Amphibacillus marinus TaxID=872970 RepID=A0A1H8LPC5_9BACI|nr:flavodoxin family protein [Amphibacillus marinus]SEO06967.1 Multimeric flavodoxin WrbA [Amphibacillus marinus]